jgi:hypothetical protein
LRFYGKGCKYNPTGDMHVHGIDYNMMFSESISNQFLLKTLNKPYVEFLAYKLGIIDDCGNKIKEPITEEEIKSYSPDVKTILKIKRYLGSKLELINQTVVLEKHNNFTYNKDKHKLLLQYEDKINNIIAELHETTEQALKDGISVEQVRTMLQ